MRKEEVNDVETGPPWCRKHKICPLQGPHLVDGVKA
jgi:hypothetical protein